MHVAVGYFRGSRSSDEIIKTFGFVTDYKRIIRGTFTTSTDAIRTKSCLAKYRRDIIDMRFPIVGLNP